MLTIPRGVHMMSWTVLLCFGCLLLSLQGAAAEDSRDSTDFAEALANNVLPSHCRSCADDDKSTNFRRRPRATFGEERSPAVADEWSRVEYDRVTPSPDLRTRFHERQRKKQWRIFETLLQLNGIMGKRNLTGAGENNSRGYSGGGGGGVHHSLPATKTGSIESRFGEDYGGGKLNKNPNLSRIITFLPTCSVQTSVKSKAFRLFFSIITPERTARTPVINVKTAILHLKRKTLKTDYINRKLDVSHNRKNKGKRANAAADEHVTKWKARIQVYNMPKGETKSVVKYFDLDPRNSTQWVKVNIRRVIEEWLKTSRKNLGLQLTIVNGRNQTIHPADVFHTFNCDQSRKTSAKATDATDNGRESEQEGGIGLRIKGRQATLISSVSSSSSSSSSPSMSTSSIPHLEVVLVKTPSSATKRMARHLPRKNNICQAIPISVKIKDLKGKWKKNVINPKSFQSNICRGTCHRCNASAQSTNITLSALGGGDSDGCCQPVKWSSPMGIVVDDDGVVRVRHIPVQVVTKCGCRQPTSQRSSKKARLTNSARFI